ncbi:flagellin [Succinimonas amylolytica]|uniref:flagellin N-terminal helical domain-containing protein n=1 Tax=Succinimonas amylolytica TaxID=83769 RepID=UPI000360464C|nr:flagellin [Succinimonas amylolytica]
MALYVNTNVASLNATRNLANATGFLDITSRRLASGLRINSARDDAAGLQISDRLTSQINGLNQGNRNAVDGISMLQVAEGAMDEITGSLQRIRGLAIQAANGSNAEADRQAIQEEVAQLSSEINRIAADTSYNGMKILSGEHDYKVTQEAGMRDQFITVRPVMMFPSGANHTEQGVIDRYHESRSYSFQVGADANETVEAAIGLKYTGNLIHYDDATGNFACSYSAYGTNIDTYLGVDLNGLYLVSGNANTAATRVVDPQEPLSQHITGFTLGKDGKVSLDVSTPDAAQKVIGYAQSFIERIDSHRAELGAVQNRLESAVRNQSNAAENVSAARSRIRDADYAQEVAEMTRTSIIQQASSAILSQANSLPQIALALLRE